MKDIGTKADGYDGILRAIQSDKFTLAEFVAHYTDLLSRGYRATRWHHPRFGAEELLPNGRWMSLAATRVCQCYPHGNAADRCALFGYLARGVGCPAEKDFTSCSCSCHHPIELQETGGDQR